MTSFDGSVMYEQRPLERLPVHAELDLLSSKLDGALKGLHCLVESGMDVSSMKAWPTMCSRLFLEMAGSSMREIEFEVRKRDGTIVDVFHIRSRLHVADLRYDIARRTNACKCSFTLELDHKFLRDCRSLAGLAKQKRRVIVIMWPRSPDLSDKQECSRYCTKCLIDAGASALLILQIWTEAGMTIDAAALHRAGFALKTIIDARANVPSLDHAHPPKTRKTLFDSQLKLAGYTATDFRRNGYTACRLSATHWNHWDASTAGEREWEETMAFFTVEELTQAGFDAEEVRIAFDRERQSQYSPSRSRSRSRDSHRRRARSSEDYQRGYAAGRTDGVLSGAGRILRNPYVNEEGHQHDKPELTVKTDYDDFFKNYVEALVGQKEKSGQAFKVSKIVINAGPWRSCDVQINQTSDTLLLDFYSPCRYRGGPDADNEILKAL